MERNVVFLLLMIAGIAVTAYLLGVDRRQVRMQKLRMKKLASSAMFKELSPLLCRARHEPVENAVVDSRGLTLRYVFPAGAETRFGFRQHGYPPLNAEKQEALVMLLEESLPSLADQSLYALRCRRRRLLNGRVESYYEYTIRNDYKARLTRAPYYDERLRSPLY
ncbi:MAG: hypothetical protein PHY12_12080 [Eubacteriales bacterium]|nr:hypothetical protein [Eubacteriales bacterium]